MWRYVDRFVICFCIFVPTTCDSYCYSDFCHKPAVDNPNGGAGCQISSPDHGEACTNLEFNNLPHVPPPGVVLSNIKLSSYVASYPELHLKLTAFKFSVGDTAFERLVTRYHDLSSEEASCRHIKLFGHSYPYPEIFFSCPFYGNSTFEGNDYKLEYLMAGKDYIFSRKLLFTVPDHVFIDEEIISVTSFMPFFYVDVSENMLILYIQPVPKKFNVLRYRVWLVNNDTKTTDFIDVFPTFGANFIQQNFTLSEGIHYFKVSAMHSDCSEYGCFNSTSPPINAVRPRRLLIMIISVVWIPPVIIYGLYYVYKLFRRKDFVNGMRRKPNCLMVYSPTHLTHINVMTNLAIYLRSCGINAMIDLLDIPESESKDPGIWCNYSFQKADVIIVATSPSSMDDDVPVIYRNVDNHLLRLIKENYPRRNKKYVAIELPYCKSDGLPEEARVFKRFIMPENLNKLIRYIHGDNKIKFSGVSSKDIVDSINIAVLNISHVRSSSPKSAKETDDLLPVLMTPILIKVDDNNICDAEPLAKDELNVNKSLQCFTTNITELNLLGEMFSPDEKSINCMSSLPANEFRVDQLEL